MAHIDSNTLKLIAEGLEDGRITEALIHRFLERPWLVSPAYRDAKELWRTRTDVTIHITDDLRRAVWYDTNHRVAGAIVHSTDGCFQAISEKRIQELFLSPSGKHIAYISDGRLYYDGEVVPQFRKEVVAACFSGENDFVVVTGNGLEGFTLHWPGGKCLEQAHCPRIASYKGHAFANAESQLWFQGKPILGPVNGYMDDILGFVVETHQDHLLVQSNNKTVSLDGKPYFEQAMDDFGFLNDGTPFGIRYRLIANTPYIYGAYLHIGQEQALDISTREQLNTRVGRGANLPLVVQTNGSRIVLVQPRGLGRYEDHTVEQYDAISGLTTFGASSFAFIGKIGKKSSCCIMSDKGDVTTSGPAFPSLKNLVVSPDGKHWAAIAAKTNNYPVTPKFVVVDGAGGMIHDDVRKLTFTSPTELRYVAVDHEETPHRSSFLHAFSVQLS